MTMVLVTKSTAYVNHYDPIINRVKGKVIHVEALIGPQGLEEVEASRIFRQFAHECGKVRPTHRLPLLTRRDPWYSFVRGSVDRRTTVRPEGLSH
jgi:hypothetical protein